MSESLIQLLDKVDAMPWAAALRTRSYELLDLPDGAGVVDVGCGGGQAVGELAGLGARAIGVDPDEEMIALARRRRPRADFRVGDACRLPLEDASVLGYRADKVFHLLADGAEALAEARRVLAPGGRIVLIGQDWDTIAIDSADPALTRTIVHARADLIASPRAARRYRNLLIEAGFADVAVEARTSVFTDAAMVSIGVRMAEAVRAAGVITAAQEAAWVDDQKARAAAGRLFVAMPIFLASAVRG